MARGNRMESPLAQTLGVSDKTPEKVEEKTKGGKEIQLVTDCFANYSIQFSTGGQLPECLKGKFTSRTEAEKAIKGYLKNAESSTSKEL